MGVAALPPLDHMSDLPAETQAMLALFRSMSVSAAAAAEDDEVDGDVSVPASEPTNPSELSRASAPVAAPVAEDNDDDAPRLIPKSNLFPTAKPHLRSVTARHASRVSAAAAAAYTAATATAASEATDPADSVIDSAGGLVADVAEGSGSADTLYVPKAATRTSTVPAARGTRTFFLLSL